jgi:hypothetical protein
VTEIDPAAAQAKKSKPTKSTVSSFDKSEFEWFSRNSYNLALEICADANPVHLVRLTTTCIQVSSTF